MPFGFKLDFLKELLATSEIGLKGIEEVEYIFKTVSQISDLKSQIELDITLARGLNYYTGAIFEAKANVGTLTSSICGGGRYDGTRRFHPHPNCPLACGARSPPRQGGRSSVGYAKEHACVHLKASGYSI